VIRGRTLSTFRKNKALLSRTYRELSVRKYDDHFSIRNTKEEEEHRQTAQHCFEAHHELETNLKGIFRFEDCFDEQSNLGSRGQPS